jgi:hypothetical protein
MGRLRLGTHQDSSVSARRRSPRSPYEAAWSDWAWSARDRESIRRAFKPGRDSKRIEEFIDEAEVHCAALREGGRPPHEIVKVLKGVSVAADALLNALEQLANDDAMRRFQLAAGERAGDDFVSIHLGHTAARLAEHWQATILIRDAARQAAEYVPRSRSSSSDDRRAEELVAILRVVWFHVCGKSAPHSRSTEFEDVAVVVGKTLGLTIGRKALAANLSSQTAPRSSKLS